MTERTIVDTGPLVALLNAKDIHHAWARAQFARREAPFLSCEAVISEAQHLVARGRGNSLLILEMLRRGFGTISPRSTKAWGCVHTSRTTRRLEQSLTA